MCKPMVPFMGKAMVPLHGKSMVSLYGVRYGLIHGDFLCGFSSIIHIAMALMCEFYGKLHL